MICLYYKFFNFLVNTLFAKSFPEIKDYIITNVEIIQPLKVFIDLKKYLKYNKILNKCILDKLSNNSVSFGQKVKNIDALIKYEDIDKEYSSIALNGCKTPDKTLCASSENFRLFLIDRLKKYQNILSIGPGRGDFEIDFFNKTNKKMICLEKNKDMARILINKKIPVYLNKELNFKETLLKNKININFDYIILLESAGDMCLRCCIKNLIKISNKNTIIGLLNMNPDFFYDSRGYELFYHNEFIKRINFFGLKINNKYFFDSKGNLSENKDSFYCFVESNVKSLMG